MRKASKMKNRDQTKTMKKLLGNWNSADSKKKKKKSRELELQN